MRKLSLALSLPGGSTIDYSNSLPKNSTFKFNNTGDLISQLLTLSLYVAGVMLVAWLIWGIFQYLFAGGNKEQLSHARKRIIFALVGFVFVVLAFTIQQFFIGLFAPSILSHPVTNITPP